MRFLRNLRRESVVEDLGLGMVFAFGSGACFVCCALGTGWDFSGTG